jgi:hypothetical protein
VAHRQPVAKVKKHKNLKYDDSYLDFGFTSTEADGKERPQCVLCMKVLASDCMLPNKLKSHLKTTHPRVVSKSRDCFSRKLKKLNQQKGSFYKLILPVAVDTVNIMIGESAGKLLSKVPLSNNINTTHSRGPQ